MASRFRTSFTQVAGTEPARILQARVANVNLRNWTVDVYAQFDRKRYFDIQVASPYLHYSSGEGVYVLPEVGATCMVCIPGDSAPPFVLAFVMPHELVDAGADDAPLGTRSHGAPARFATDASFAGGRPKAKPGDIYLRTRDDNFVILHRGGVLQIGATELAQRIYLPLTNLITDIAENYAHHNSGGSIVWGLRDGPSQANPPAEYVHTFRVFANDKYADVRVAVGKVHAPVPEPDGGVALATAGVGQADEAPIVCEVTVSPKGFVAETGDVASSDAGKASVLKFVFDRAGNTLFRCEGTLTLQVTKKLTLRAGSDVLFSTDGQANVRAVNGLDLDGGAYAHVKGDIVRLGAGTTPVARLQDLVTVPVTAQPVILLFQSPPIPNVPALALLTTGAPGLPMPLVGSITSANTKVLA